MGDLIFGSLSCGFTPQSTSALRTAGEAMRQAGMTQAQGSADARQVRRILDLDHESILAQMESALGVLGRRATVTVSKLQGRGLRREFFNSHRP